MAAGIVGRRIGERRAAALGRAAGAGRVWQTTALGVSAVRAVRSRGPDRRVVLLPVGGWGRGNLEPRDPDRPRRHSCDWSRSASLTAVVAAAPVALLLCTDHRAADPPRAGARVLLAAYSTAEGRAGAECPGQTCLHLAPRPDRRHLLRYQALGRDGADTPRPGGRGAYTRGLRGAGRRSRKVTGWAERRTNRSS